MSTEYEKKIWQAIEQRNLLNCQEEPADYEELNETIAEMARTLAKRKWLTDKDESARGEYRLYLLEQAHECARHAHACASGNSDRVLFYTYTRLVYRRLVYRRLV